MSTPSFGQALHALTLISQKDPTLESLSALFQSGFLSDLLEAKVSSLTRDDFRKFVGLDPLVLSIVVDYSMTLGQMIAAGSYDWVNDEITPERFPVKGTGKISLKPELVHFKSNIFSEKVLEELDKMGLRPGTHKELLAFGATYPNMQNKFPVVALGSSCHVYGGDRYVACLGRGDSGRYLDLGWWGGAWGDGFRFLAFAK